MTTRNDKSILGRNIAQYRKEVRLTQEELARNVGIHKSYLSAIENGHVMPSYKLLVQIAECLGIPARRLAMEKDTEG